MDSRRGSSPLNALWDERPSPWPLRPVLLPPTPSASWLEQASAEQTWPRAGGWLTPMSLWAPGGGGSDVIPHKALTGILRFSGAMLN